MFIAKGEITMKKRNIILLVAGILLLCCVIYASFLKDTQPSYKKTETVPDTQTQKEETRGADDADDADESLILPVEERVETETGNNNMSQSNEIENQTSEKKDSVTTQSSVGSKDSSEKHVHDWQPVVTTVYHEKKLIKEAWTEMVPIYDDVAVEICGNCGADCTENRSEHIKEHMLNGTGKYGCRTEYRQKQIGEEEVHHEAEYSEAWTENITTYKCACGATKDSK